MEEVRGSLVVLGWGKHAAEHPEERPLESAPARVEAAWAIDRDAAHEDELDRRCGLQRFDPTAQARRRSRDEVARRSEDALEAEDVTETGDDGIAAAKVPLQLLIAKRQQAGLDHRQVGVPRDVGRELPARSHDGANADAALQELLQHAPARASGAANEKNGLLRGHVYVSFKHVGSARPGVAPATSPLVAAARERRDRLIRLLGPQPSEKPAALTRTTEYQLSPDLAMALSARSKAGPAENLALRSSSHSFRPTLTTGTRAPSSLLSPSHHHRAQPDGNATNLTAAGHVLAVIAAPKSSHSVDYQQLRAQ